MTYSPFLDRLFGSLVGSALVLVLLLATTLALYLTWALRRGRESHGMAVWLLGTVAFCWLFLVAWGNAAWLGYGPVTQVTDARVDGDAVVLLDYRNAAGGEGDDPTPYYRVHVLDARNGRPRFRTHVGTGARLAALTPEQVIVERYGREFVYVDRRTGDVKVRLSTQNVQEHVPALAGEGALQWEGAEGDFVRLRADDGRVLWLSTLDWTVHRERPRPISSARAGLGGYELRIDGRTLLALRSTGEDRRRRIAPEGQAAQAREETYLDGRFVAFAPDTTGVVLHAASTSWERPLLTGVALQDGAPLWSLPAERLRAGDAEGKAEVIVATSDDASRLVVAVDARVVVLEPGSGRVLWERDL